MSQVYGPHGGQGCPTAYDTKLAVPKRDLRSRVGAEHVLLLDQAAASGETVYAIARIADVLAALGWLETMIPSMGAERGHYRITDLGRAVHAKAHGRSLAETPTQEAPDATEGDGPEPFGCSAPSITRAPPADTWGLGR